MKKSILIALILFGTQAHALGTSTVGNGGDVVDCGPQAPLMLLDVYEKTVVERQRFFLNEFSGDASAKFTQYLYELKRYSPYNGKVLQKSVAALKSQVTWTQNELFDVSDSQHVLFPVGCKIRQIAIQTRADGVTSKLEINRDLYERLDEGNKAALWMHEAIYSEAIDLGQANSVRTRALNGIMISGSYTSEKDLNLARRQNGFRFFETLEFGDTVIHCPTGEKCGVWTTKGFFYETQDPKALRIQSIGMVGDIEFKNGNKDLIPGLNIKVFSPYYSTLELFAPSSYVFDGKVFTCLAGRYNQVELSAQNFVRGRGFIGQPLVSACVGSFAGRTLPSHFTDNLLNDQPNYRIEFSYVFGNEGVRPAGISYKQRYQGKWALGFTLYENLNFNSYQENWHANQVIVENATGSYREPGANSIDCNIDGTVRILMRNKGPLLLETSPKEEKKLSPESRCILGTANGKIQVNYFKRNSEGELVSAEVFRDQPLPFLGKSAYFQGKVNFRDSSVVYGKLTKSLYGEFNINGETSEVWLPADLNYTVDQDQRFSFKSDPNPYASFPGLQVDHQDRSGIIVNLPKEMRTKEQRQVVVEYGFLSPQLELQNGKLKENAILPACYYDVSAKKVKSKMRNVDADTILEMRSKRDAQTGACYWLRTPGDRHYQSSRVYSGWSIQNVPGKEIMVKTVEALPVENFCNFDIENEQEVLTTNTWFDAPYKLKTLKGKYDSKTCMWLIR